MRKVVSLLLVVVLVMGFVGMVSASTKWDNWSAVFDTDNVQTGYENAGGTIVANYVKGKGEFVVSADLWGLEDDYRYILVYTKDIGGTWTPMTLSYFTTDFEGKANFSIQGWKMESKFTAFFNPADGTSHFNVFRYPVGATKRIDPYVLSTYYTRTDEPLTDAGSNRGE